MQQQNGNNKQDLDLNYMEHQQKVYVTDLQE